MKADLVLEGGGVKGIGLVGAVARLGQQYTFQRVAGTSVGALVGSLVAAGFDGSDLEDELFAFPFDEVMHPDLLDRLPLLGPLASIGFERGVWETSRVRDHLAAVLIKRGISTFGDLRLDDAGSSLPPERRYRLVVTTTDVTTGELLYLPWDYADHLGLDPDAQLVADAVAASIAIPFFFEPITVTDDRDTEHVLVDGGLLSNFPITVFDRTDHTRPRWPTFGLKILPRLPEGAQELVPFAGRVPLAGIRHLEAVFATALVGRDQTFLSEPGVEARTIEIDTSGVGVIEFGLSDSQKHELRDNGWNEADRFLAEWDWDEYRREHRPPRVGSDSEPMYPLTLLVEVDQDDATTRDGLQALVDRVLVEDADGEPWTVRRFFDDADSTESVEGHYEVRGLVPVSPAYPVRALGFELATVLTEAMTGELAGRAMPDFPSRAFGREVDLDDTGDEPAVVATAETGGPSWPLEVMRCPEAWLLEPAPGGAQRGEGIVIGHPDTGFTWHQELTDSLDLTQDHDIIDEDRVAEDPLKKRWWWPLDSPGHGTSTGSVIISPEAHLITGTAPDATLIPMRAIRSVVQVSDGDVARAIDRARTAGAHVISMSLGGVGFYSGIRTAIQKARDEGIIVMAAAGNQVRIVVAPARFEECIAVAGTDQSNQPWSGSSRGDPVLISAPGHEVPIAKAEKGSEPTDQGTAVSVSSGTSYAVAHLAGVAALWLAHHGRDALLDRYGPLGVQEAFEEVLTTVGFTRPDPWDDRWGVGIVDAVKVLEADLPDPIATPKAAAARASGPVERLAELGATPSTDARGDLCSLLGCDDTEVDELARCHGAELAYLYAEGELPTPVAGAGATAEAAARAAPPSAVMSPSLRSRLDASRP